MRRTVTSSVLLWALLCSVAWAQSIDTQSWAAHDGQPATAQTSSLAVLSGPGAVHRTDATAPGGVYISSSESQPLEFRINPPAQQPGDTARIWFALRAMRTPGAVFVGNPSFRLNQIADGTLRTTTYLSNDSPWTAPNGAHAKAHGLNLYTQSDLPGGIDAGLAGTGYVTGAPVASFETWTTFEVEVVRGVQGRYVVLVNGVPTQAFLDLDNTSLTPAQIDASLTVSLPAINGLAWHLSGPLGSSDQPHAYLRGGTQFPQPASVSRLLAIPATLSAPWSPFDLTTHGEVTATTDTFVTSALLVDRRRLTVSGLEGSAATLRSQPLGDTQGGSGGWTTLVMRDVWVEPTANTELFIEHPGGLRTSLTVSSGWLRHNNVPLLPWNYQYRYNVLIHVNTDAPQGAGGEGGERSVTLINTSSVSIDTAILSSAPLPPLGAPAAPLGAAGLSAEFATDGRVEIGGMAVCRRVDIMMVDSYVAALTTLDPPGLLTLSRLGRVFFSGVDVDLVPNRPTFADQHPDAPMAMVLLGRPGGRLSLFLATNGQGATHTRGSRFFLNAGFVNELSVQPNDAYVVNSYELAARKAQEVADQLAPFVQSVVNGGNDMVFATPVTVPLYAADHFKAMAFDEYNNHLRQIVADHAANTGGTGGGRVLLADAAAQLNHDQRNALYSPDMVHMSAVGDITYARIITDALRPPPCITVVPDSPAVTRACPGDGFDAKVVANGPPPLSYAWHLNGLPLSIAQHPSAATPWLAIPSVQATDAGLYTCVVSGPCGSASSEPSQLTINLADMGKAGGVPGSDGLKDNNDFIVFINCFFQHSLAADLGKQGGIPGADGTFDNNDFIAFINMFFQSCP